MGNEKAEASDQAAGENTEPQAEPQPTAESKKTEQPSEHMIPKSRFDEINNELKRLRKEADERAAAQKKADEQAAAEQGKYQELYEKLKAENEASQTKIRDMELKSMRRNVADQVGLSSVFAERLQGSTEEEMLADAKAILDAMPKPTAPNISPGAGDGTAPLLGKISDQERKELAAIYGVNEKYFEM